MKIGIIMSRKAADRKSIVMPEVVRLLTEYGVQVEIIYPEDHLNRLCQLRPVNDLYVLKDTGDMGLGLAGILHAAGAAIINPYPASVILRDKIASTGVLKAAQLPVPDTFVTSELHQLAYLLKDGPLVIKPYRGKDGQGVRVVREESELVHPLDRRREPVFAQRYRKPDGPDHKLYVIDGQVFGVLRKWPAATYKEKLGVPLTVTPALRNYALRCGEAFGVKIFGLDVVISKGEPYIVDVQSFPGFKGVPDAALRLADYIYHVGRQVLNKKT
ncbi:MAG: ATP-grasp domain-containing protein [Elusimicrobia bacterium]|nr:ATP-grasp domain-containing protein [Elusimicrobiota bacterium]